MTEVGGLTVLLAALLTACSSGRSEDGSNLGLDTSAAQVREVTSTVAPTGAIGPIFGIWPARRAASLNPIEALRYE